MTGSVTWEALVFIVGLILSAGAAVAGVLLWHNSQINAMQRNLDAFKTEVAKEYAPLSALFKDEARLAVEIGNLRTDFNAGFDRVVKIMQAMVPPRLRKSLDPLE